MSKLGGLVSVLVVAWSACVASGCKKESTHAGEQGASAPLIGRRTVSALGKIEPGEGQLPIGGPMGERIASILVTDGQEVNAGEQLVELMAEQVLSAQLDLARGKLDRAQEQYELEKARGEAMVAEAEGAIERASELPELQVLYLDSEVKIIEVQLQQAERDLDRLKDLSPMAELDRQKDIVDRIREQLRAARNKYRVAQKERELSQKEAEKRLATAKATTAQSLAAIDVDTARRNVALAQAELARISILSPIDGVVLDVLMQPGQAIGQQPILILGETDAMYVSAEVYETDVDLVEAGQKATIQSPALPEKLTGKVERIGQMVHKNEVFGIDPTGRTDARVIEVRIRLDNPKPAAEYIGLQVEVSIDTDSDPSATASQ